MAFEFISNLGIYIFFISIALGLIFFFYIQQEDFYRKNNSRYGGYLDETEEGKYKWSKYISLVGLWFITFLIWFRYIEENQGMSIVNIFETLKTNNILVNSEFFWLYIILFFIAICFPLPTLFALISSFIAISSIDLGIILFIFFATLQTISYIYLDFEEIDLTNKIESLEFFASFLSLFVSVMKILSKVL